jgi:hypothetical protein
VTAETCYALRVGQLRLLVLVVALAFTVIKLILAATTPAQ